MRQIERKLIERLLIEVCCVVLLLLVAALLIFRQTPLGLATTPDSLSYLDMAANAHQGHGLLASDFAFNARGQRYYIEQRLWPRLYPWVLSWKVQAMNAVQQAVQISMLLLGAALLGVYAYCRQFLTPGISVLAVIGFAISVPVTTVYNFVWSETLFIPGVVWLAVAISCYFGQFSRYSPWRMLSGVVVLIVLVALAYTRYIGIIFGAVLPIMLLWSIKKRKDRIFWLVCLLVYALPVGWMLIDNMQLTGYLSGGARQPSDKNIIGLLQDCAGVLSLSISQSMIINALAVLGAVIAVLYASVERKGHSGERVNTPQMAPLMVMASFYFIGIAGLRLNSQFDDIDVRLLSPLMPLLWLVLVSLAASINHQCSRLLAVISLTIILNMVMAGYVHWQENVQHWQQDGEPVQRKNAGEAYLNFTSQRFLPLQTAVASVLSDKAVVVFQTPILAQFLTGRPAFRLPALATKTDILQLNNLPKGSVMILPAQSDVWQAAVRKFSIRYEAAEVAGWWLIKLPVSVMEGRE